MKTRYISLLLLVFFCSWAGVSAITLDEAKKFITEKDYPEAVTAFRTLMRNKTMAARADCNKWFGEALCMTGQYEEARPYLEFAARKQVKGAYWYLGICYQKTYHFAKAIETLQKYKTLMRTSAEWQVRSDSVIAECEVAMKAVTHVRDVVIIDSLSVSRRAFFAHYRLGSESGRMLAAEECSGFGDAVDAVVFENQTGDYRLFVREENGGHSLYETRLFNGEWETPSAVALTVGGRRLAYPFLRSDGETLYFATDAPGMGGWDLYKTHYNADAGTYYTPERLGMPFNSPHDDYMMAIDETHQVGWWATNRNCHPDFVTIYLFLLDDDIAYLDGEQPSRGRIESIRDTWRDTTGYASLVEEVMTAPQVAERKAVLHIIIDDAHIYTSADDFRDATARAYYDRAVSTRGDLDRLIEEIDGLRAEWRTAPTARKQQLRSAILQREQREETLRGQIAEWEKKYRTQEGRSL